MYRSEDNKYRSGPVRGGYRVGVYGGPEVQNTVRGGCSSAPTGGGTQRGRVVNVGWAVEWTVELKLNRLRSDIP